MHIASIACGFPTLSVTNEDLLGQVLAANRSLPEQMVEQYCSAVRDRLNRAGSAVRLYRDKSKNETAYGILMDTIDRALQKAAVAPNDIDLLIYCGVGRGFLEPAMAYFVADGIGASCDCFDIIDACMSWVRALFLAYHLFAHAGYKHALIVNAEFNIYECGYPSLMEIRSADQWKHTFPAFTVGEAATATVLNVSDKVWNFHFKSLPAHVGLCALPLKGYADFCSPRSDHLALSGVNNFMCLGDSLSARAQKEMLRFIAETYGTGIEADKWFPHLAAGEPYRRTARALGIQSSVYTATFARYGNLASASIPVAMQAAETDGQLKRGDRIVLCPISAGMSLALADLSY